MSKILFLYEPVGSGHQVAAESLALACQSLLPGVTTQILDPFGEIWSGIPALMTGINTLTLLLAPHVHDEVWQGSDQMNWIEKLIDLKPLKEAFLKLMLNLAPDLVVTTHDMPCSFLAELRQAGDWPVPLVSVITDFAAHPYWPTSGVDRYLVAAAEVREQLAERGMEPNRVYVTGIPISASFSKPRNQARARRELELLDIPTVLIIAGGLRMGPYVTSQLLLDQIVQELDRVSGTFQVIVVTGSNTALKKYIEGRVRRLTRPVQVTGFVQNMPDYMAAADLLISKPGGLVSSEALASGLPMVSFKAGPGQERANQEYLLAQGAAEAAGEAPEVAEVVAKLIRDPARLGQMRRRAQAMGRPYSAADGARLIANMLYARETKGRALLTYRPGVLL